MARIGAVAELMIARLLGMVVDYETPEDAQ